MVTEAYQDCHGLWSAANDCFASKGFIGLELYINGHLLHVYNTHLDAGRNPEDRATRHRQLAQLATAIETFSSDASVIVAGDLNLRRTDAADALLLTEFLTTTGLRDSGAKEPYPFLDGYRMVDYILFRAHTTTELNVTHGGEAHEFRLALDEPLSDHPPLFIELTVSSDLDEV